ncbi:MAG: hypothetical protein RL660_91 [Bacteroidota bacterium]|jgi:Fur family ferric uptake transcriptional regulator
MNKSRNTIAKTQIKKILDEANIAYSRQELQDLLSGVCDRVTVYRVLDRLEASNEVHRVVTPEGVIKYASCVRCDHSATQVHNHYHCCCSICGKVECMYNYVVTLPVVEHCEITFANLAVTSVCSSCKAKKVAALSS